MKSRIIFLAGLVLLLAATLFADNEGVHVYGPVPGLTPSEFYSFRVRTVGSTEWLEPFAFITRGKDGTDSHYYDQLKDWSNTYINFEMSNGVPVEIEISKVGGAPITHAVPHPAHKVNSCTVSDGKAYVVIDDPALFAVDIDGQMDEQDTSRITPDGWGDDAFYSGPPIHTLTVFANPFLQDKPSTNDPNVFRVEPGVVPADTGAWGTLYFLPGVHDIGKDFRVHENKNYYIPGNAIVYGTFNNNKDSSDGENILIFGHGTLSGERIPHPDDDTPPAPDSDDRKYKPIDIVGAKDTTVEGITIADSAMHSLMLVNGYQPDRPTDIRWVKIFTWRGNGDGINPFGNGLIEDCFIRTADDCTYVNGRGIRRCVFWTDVNGSAFTMSPIGGIANPDLVVEDCDIIYNRSLFPKGLIGGRVFNMRGAGSGEGGSNVTFRNIRVTDSRPTRSCFAIQTASSYVDDPNYGQVRGDGDIVGIRFENISIAAPSILGYPETLWGNTNSLIRDCTFENVTMAGVPFTSINDFNHNEYVTNLMFLAPQPKTNVFLNTGGDGKWNTAGNWDAVRVPSAMDEVRHNSIGGVLSVDSAAYADDLYVSHNSTAVVSVVAGGALSVVGTVEIGNSGATGVGVLRIDGGDVTIAGSAEFGIFGAERQGIGELNAGSMTVSGNTVFGGWNAASGSLTINSGTWNQVGGKFSLARTGNGSLTMNAGMLNISSPEWNPLRVGDNNNTGNATIDLNGGAIYTPGVQMDWNEADAGSATINLSGGLLQIEGGFGSALRMADDALLNFGKGMLMWKGNRIGDFSTLVNNGYIDWSGGQTNMLTGSWDFSWTNGPSILFADFDDVSDGYTTVWALDTTPPESVRLDYARDTVREADSDDDSIEEIFTMDLTDDTFTADVVSGGYVTAGNVPAGLVAVFTRVSDSRVSLGFTGNAVKHAAEDSITDLTISFADGAFSGGDAGAIAGSERSDLRIIFDPGLNVLFIAIEDLNDWIGPLGGHPQVQTPHLDSFAQSAVTFTSAYCLSTVCGPSRLAILTGKHATNTGVYGNKNNLKDAPLAMNLETLPEYFGNRGYYTLTTGKIFHKHATETSIDEGQWAFHEVGYTDPTWGLSWETTLPGHPEYRWGAWSAPTEDTLDFVKSRWAADQLDCDFGGKPFFMALGLAKPHLPFHAPEEFFDLYPLTNIITAEYLSTDYDDIVKPNGNPVFTTPPGGDAFVAIETNNYHAEITRAYLATISYVDACIGHVIDAVDASPYADNTVIMLWSDHGWHLGEKLRYGKTWLWEESARVPFMVRVPGAAGNGAVCDRVVNLIDMYPTLLDLCGLPSNPENDGRSFAPLMDDPTMAWDFPTLTTYQEGNHSITDGRYRYTLYRGKGDAEELYDHQTDPMEYTNLAYNPAYADVVAELSAYLPDHDEPESPENPYNDLISQNRTAYKAEVEAWATQKVIVSGIDREKACFSIDVPRNPVPPLLPQYSDDLFEWHDITNLTPTLQIHDSRTAMWEYWIDLETSTATQRFFRALFDGL